MTNPNLLAQVDSILRNRERENTVFVSHAGDIVDRNCAEEWAVAKQRIDRLRGAFPFSLAVGNHEMTSKGDARLFQSHFPATSFQSYPWYLGCFTHQRPDQHISANNVNSAQIFRAGGIDFIHLSLKCNAPDDVLAWADALLRQHGHRRPRDSVPAKRLHERACAAPPPLPAQSEPGRGADLSGKTRPKTHRILPAASLSAMFSNAG